MHSIEVDLFWIFELQIKIKGLTNIYWGFKIARIIDWDLLKIFLRFFKICIKFD